jgi:hypothetical protein
MSMFLNEEILDPQRAPSWIRKRVGKATASRMYDLSARLKSGKGFCASRDTYLREIVFERLTDRAYSHYVNDAMRWGNDNQDEARDTYKLHTGNAVELADFVQHPLILMSGASPDGLVGDTGLVEMKCPTSATHIATLLADAIPEENKPQMLWQMACTGRSWCDFVSYDPRLPPSMQVWIGRLDRDDAAIAALEEDVKLFLEDVDKTVAYLQERYPS